MSEREWSFFDLHGHLVLQDMVTPKEVAAANAAIIHHVDLVQRRQPGLAQGAEHLVAPDGARRTAAEPLTFDRPWCRPLRRMLRPPGLDILNQILGTGFRLDQGLGLIQMDDETEGHRLHGGMISTRGTSRFLDTGACTTGCACGLATHRGEARAGLRLHPRQPQGQLPPAPGGLELDEDWGVWSRWPPRPAR